MTWTRALRGFTLAAAVAASACGGNDNGGGLTDPPDIPSDPSDPGDPTPAPAPVGRAIYAVDLANNLLVFGTGSPGVVSRLRRISGVPILKRIVGIDFRPSDRKLYGVGNDSRVYLIDTLTAVATPVSETPFSPGIISSFDIHFGMGFDPVTERIRLMSAELGVNWSISPDDGSATTGNSPRYAAGDENEGRTPRVVGLAYTPPAIAASARPALSASVARMVSAYQGPCEDLMYAIDADMAEIIGSCDPDEGDFTSLGGIDGLPAIAGCAEVKMDDVAPPDSPGHLWLSLQRGAEHINSLGSVNEDGSITWHGDVPDESPIQAMAFEPASGPAPMKVAPHPSASAAATPVRPAAATAGGLKVTCPGAH